MLPAPTPTPQGPLLAACARNAFYPVLLSCPEFFLSSKFFWPVAASWDTVLGRILKYLSFSWEDHLSNRSILLKFLELQAHKPRAGSLGVQPYSLSGPWLIRGPYLVSCSALATLRFLIILNKWSHSLLLHYVLHIM